jgi:hypothetical protein
MQTAGVVMPWGQKTPWFIGWWRSLLPVDGLVLPFLLYVNGSWPCGDWIVSCDHLRNPVTRWLELCPLAYSADARAYARTASVLVFLDQTGAWRVGGWHEVWMSVVLLSSRICPSAVRCRAQLKNGMARNGQERRDSEEKLLSGHHRW